MAVSLVDVHGVDCFSRSRVVAVNHLDGLAAQVLAQYREVAVLEGGFVDVELVRVDRTLYDGLTEPVRRRNEDDITEARLGVQRKQDA